MILTLDKEKGRVSLSTKKLEPTPGDMVRDPALVFARADEMAAAFRWAAPSPSSVLWSWQHLCKLCFFRGLMMHDSWEHLCAHEQSARHVQSF
jgi:hypothetical protein